MLFLTEAVFIQVCGETVKSYEKRRFLTEKNVQMSEKTVAWAEKLLYNKNK